MRVRHSFIHPLETKFLEREIGREIVLSVDGWIAHCGESVEGAAVGGCGAMYSD